MGQYSSLTFWVFTERTYHINNTMQFQGALELTQLLVSLSAFVHFSFKINTVI